MTRTHRHELFLRFSVFRAVLKLEEAGLKPSDSQNPKNVAPLRAAVALGLTALMAVPAVPANAQVTIPVDLSARKAASLPTGESIELSLDQAIALALQNTLDLTVAAGNYEKSGFSIMGAQGAFDPTLNLEASASSSSSTVTSAFQSSGSKSQRLDAYFSGLLDTGATYQFGFTNQRSDVNRPAGIPPEGFRSPSLGSSLTAQVTQPLFRNFGRSVNRRFIVQNRIARDTSAWQFVRRVQDTVKAVEDAYWDLLYAQANLKSRLEALDRAKDLNRITKIKIDVGALAPIDIVQTEVTIAQREQDIILAEGAIGDAQDLLRRLLNVQNVSDWARPIVPTDQPSFEEQKVDAEEGIRRALESRVEVKQAIVDIESRKITLAYNNNQVRPRLDAVGSYGLSGTGVNVADESYSDAYKSIGKADNPSWSIGLNFAMPIFNRTARANAAIARTDLELGRTNLAILKQNIALEVRAAGRRIDTAFRSIAAARKSRELAERNVDAEKKKFENGMTTSFQVSQIQNDLTTARSNELLAIASYRKAINAWHNTVGDILSYKKVTLEGLPVTLDPTPAEEGAVR